MKPEALWLFVALLTLGDGESLDYGEEKIGKAGYCPAFPTGLYQPPCTVECESDSECTGAMKCCEFACQYSCTAPVKEKPGLCPSPLMKKLYVPASCMTTCMADEDCVGAQKCCETACGRTCRLPLQEKPGKCPKKEFQKNAGPSADTCLHDQECLGAEKCCFTGSSMNCLNVSPGRASPPGQEAARAWALVGPGIAKWPRKGPSSSSCRGK